MICQVNDDHKMGDLFCLFPKENQIDEGGKLELSQKKDAMEAKEASDDIKPLMHIKMLTKFKNVAPGQLMRIYICKLKIIYL